MVHQLDRVVVVVAAVCGSFVLLNQDLIWIEDVCSAHLTFFQAPHSNFSLSLTQGDQFQGPCLTLSWPSQSSSPAVATHTWSTASSTGWDQF